MTLALREKSSACNPVAANEDSVFLALSILSPCRWIVPDLLSILPPARAYEVLRLCAGLTFAPGAMRGVEKPLSNYLTSKELSALFALQDSKTFDFPPFRVVKENIDKAKCYAYSKAFGEVETAARLGIPKRLVHSRRFFVHRKIREAGR